MNSQNAIRAAERGARVGNPQFSIFNFQFSISRWRAARTRLLTAATLLLALSLFAAKKPAKMKPPPKVPAGKPEIFQLEPRGIQRGVEAKIKLIGTNLIGLTELKLHHAQLEGALLPAPAPTTNEAWITIT